MVDSSHRGLSCVRDLVEDLLLSGGEGVVTGIDSVGDGDVIVGVDCDGGFV